MLDGAHVSIGGTEYVIPPLNLKALRRLAGDLERLSKMTAGIPTEEELGAIAAILHAAMVRNYPELKLDDVEDMIDMGNMFDILAVVMGASGLVKKSGDGTGPGAGSP